MEKRILILAGPNGAGKTTFAREFLVREVSCPAFVNADLIAAGLSPFDPARVALRSGRLMLELIAEHVARGESFAFETTLAGRNFARAIEQWRSAAYHVSLIFLSLPSADLAVHRVAQRCGRAGTLYPRRMFVDASNAAGTCSSASTNRSSTRGCYTTVQETRLS
jgi:predicted ABC-type ATPase